MASNTNGRPSSHTTPDVETSGGDDIEMQERTSLLQQKEPDMSSVSSPDPITSQSNTSITNASEDTYHGGIWTFGQFNRILARDGNESKRLHNLLEQYQDNLKDFLIVRDSNYRSTFLHIVIYNNLYELFKELVSFISNKDSSLLNIPDNSGRTALHMAVGKDYRFTELLVDSSANVNAQDNDGDTPLHVLASGADFDNDNALKCLNILCSSQQLDLNLRHPTTKELPLHYALKMGSLADSDMLIKKMTNEKGNTDLMKDSYSLVLSVINGIYISGGDSHEHIKCLERLFENDVLIDVNQRNVDNEKGNVNTALHVAAYNDYQEVMKILIQNGAYVLQQRIVNGHNDGNVVENIEKETLMNVMDSFITPLKTPSDINRNSFKLDYSFIIPPNDGQGLASLNSAPVYFLKHPLMSTLLNFKMQSFGLSHEMDSFFYGMFTGMLFFSFCLIPSSAGYCGTENQSKVNVTEDKDYIDKNDPKYAFWLMCNYFALVPFACCFIIHSHVMCYLSRAIHAEAVLAIIIGVLSILPGCLITEDVLTLQHIYIWTIVLVFYRTMISGVDENDIVSFMFRSATKKMFRYYQLLAIPVFSFTVLFMIFSELFDCQTYDRSIHFFNNMFGMAAGDFDFYSEEITGKNNTFLHTISFMLMFLFFFFFVYLVMMNLVTGVAVADVKECSDDTDGELLKSKWSSIEQHEKSIPLWRIIECIVPFACMKNYYRRRIEYLSRPTRENPKLSITNKRYELQNSQTTHSENILSEQLASSLRAIARKNLRKKKVSSSDSSHDETVRESREIIMAAQQTSEKTILETLQNLERSIKDVQERLKNL